MDEYGQKYITGDLAFITGELVHALYSSRSDRVLVAERLLTRPGLSDDVRQCAQQIIDSVGQPDETDIRTEAIHRILNLLDPVNYGPGWDA